MLENGQNEGTDLTTVLRAEADELPETTEVTQPIQQNMLPVGVPAGEPLTDQSVEQTQLLEKINGHLSAISFMMGGLVAFVIALLVTSLRILKNLG